MQIITLIGLFGLMAGLFGGNPQSARADDSASHADHFQKDGKNGIYETNPSALTSNLPAGSYVGETSSGREFVLMLRQVSARNPRYLATLIEQDFARVSLYFIESLPIDDVSYAMKLVTATSDGEIGIPNPEPTLVLTLGAKKDERVTFTVSNSNSGYSAGFQGVIRFDGQASKYAWEGHTEGRYTFVDDSTKTAEISPMGEELLGKAILDVGPSLNGNFSLREKAPGAFTLNSFVVKSAGGLIAPSPRRLGIFISERASHAVLFRQTKRYFLLVNPKIDTDVLVFVRK